MVTEKAQKTLSDRSRGWGSLLAAAFIEFVLSNEGVNYGLPKIMLWALPHEESRTEK